MLQLQSLAHHRICECVLPIEIVQSRGIGRVRQPVIGITPLEAMRCSCKRSFGSHRSNRDAERVTQTCSRGSIKVPARTSKQSTAAWKQVPGYVPWETREEQRRQYSRKLRHGYNIFQSRTCKFMRVSKRKFRECPPQSEHQVPRPLPVARSISNKERGEPPKRRPSLDEPIATTCFQNRDHMHTL